MMRKDKEKFRKESPIEWQKLYSYVLMAILPILGYILFEMTTGNLFSISLRRAFLNIIFYYFIYGLVYLCLNRFRIAAISTSAVLYIIAAVDYYVLQFRGNPLLLPQDLFAWRTAAAVVSNYKITLSKSIACGGIFLVILIAALCFARIPRINWKKRGIFAGGYLALAFAWLLAFYKYDIKVPLADVGDDVFWWSLSGSYEDFGYMTSTAIFLKSTVFEKPEDYSLEAAREAADSVKHGQLPVSDVSPENLIVIMNESLSDPKVIGDFETNQEYFPFIDSLKENTIKSDLYVQVFGGGTSNTEYEALTGNTMSFLPYVISAFQAYCKTDEYGLASTLKEQGYTTVAMHPNISGNWNRKTVYQYMGFDEFISSGGFQEQERLRNYVSDQGDYERLIERYEEKEAGEKIFFFNVTMQNHGGYEEAFPEFQEQIQLTGEYAEYEQASRYLSLMKESDDAFAYLVDYFSRVEEPTMIVLFGDHQAAIETEFYEALYGKTFQELTAQEAERQYMTPLVIWTNYDMENREIEKISANYLSSMILELANLEMTPYQSFLLGVWEEIPVLGKNGYYLADGTYYPWSQDSRLPDILHKYQLLEYNYVADRRHRLNELFTLAQ